MEHRCTPSVILWTACILALVAGDANVVSRITEVLLDGDVSDMSNVNTGVPVDINKYLSKQNKNWTSLSDEARVGLLWAYGYVLVGDSDYNHIAPVYTACEKNVDRIDTKGASMDTIALSSASFNKSCEVEECDGFHISTNKDCSSRLPSTFTCAVGDIMTAPNGQSTSEFETSRGPIWSDANASGMVYPQVYRNTITVGSSSMTVMSIQFEESDASSCPDEPDTTIPCLLESSISSKASFCRPTPMDVSKLLAAETSAQQSGGLKTWVIIIIVVGAAVVVAGCIVFWWLRRKKRNDKSPALGGPFGPTIMESQARQRQRRESLSSDRQVSSYHLDESVAREKQDAPRSNPVVRTTRQEPVRPKGSSSMVTTRKSRPKQTSSGGAKTVEEYCSESETLKTFVSDSSVRKKLISYQDITFLRLLSKGAYGEVWLGQFETKYVAIKKLLPEKAMQTVALEQFTGEIRLVAALHHPNIVSFIGLSWNFMKDLCVVVEYMEAGDLDVVLNKHKNQFTWPKEKLSIAMDIAEGLVYLHCMRPVVVHRDIKSKNVLLNKNMRAKLTDFGVSRKTKLNETMTSGVGTLLWTAPEIVLGKKYSERADVYSLGIVLSEIDTEEAPFASVRMQEDGTPIPGMQLAHLVRKGQIRAPFRDDCPRSIRELAEQCTNLDPDQRPTSMQVAYTLKSIIAPSLRHSSTPSYLTN